MAELQAFSRLSCIPFLISSADLAHASGTSKQGTKVTKTSPCDPISLQKESGLSSDPTSLPSQRQISVGEAITLLKRGNSRLKGLIAAVEKEYILASKEQLHSNRPEQHGLIVDHVSSPNKARENVDLAPSPGKILNAPMSPSSFAFCFESDNSKKKSQHLPSVNGKSPHVTEGDRMETQQGSVQHSPPGRQSSSVPERRLGACDAPQTSSTRGSGVGSEAAHAEYGGRSSMLARHGSSVSRARGVQSQQPTVVEDLYPEREGM